MPASRIPEEVLKWLEEDEGLAQAPIRVAGRALSPEVDGRHWVLAVRDLVVEIRELRKAAGTLADASEALIRDNAKLSNELGNLRRENEQLSAEGVNLFERNGALLEALRRAELLHGNLTAENKKFRAVADAAMATYTWDHCSADCSSDPCPDDLLAEALRAAGYEV